MLEVVAEKAVRSLAEGQRRVEEGQRRLERVLESIQRDVSSLAGFVSGFRPPAPEPRPAPVPAPETVLDGWASAHPDGDALAAEAAFAKAEGAASRALSFQELAGVSGPVNGAGAPAPEIPAAVYSEMVPSLQVVESTIAAKPPSLPIHYGDLEEPEVEQTKRKSSRAMAVPLRFASNSSIAEGKSSEVSSEDLAEKQLWRGTDFGVTASFSFQGSSEQLASRMNENSALERAWPGDVQIRGPEGNSEGKWSAGAGGVHRTGRQQQLGRQKSKQRQNRVSGSIATAMKISGHRFLVHPSSAIFAFWSTLGAFFLLNDLTITPFVLAWDITVQSGWLWVMSWVTPAFWTVDVMLCFITCYYTGGRLETRLPEIAKRYLMTWFIPDVVIVACDWVGIALQAVSEDGIEGTDAIRVLRIGKTVKMLRIAGLMRLTRLLRFMRFMRGLKEYFEEKTAGFPVSSQCIFLSVCALWFNHVIGCAWFAVGRLANSDTGKHWTDYYMEHRGEILPFVKEDMWYQYVTSLHWSLAQFTLGANEISCTNSTERCFNIICLLIGLIFGSTLVSSLSAGMVDYQMRMMEKKNKMRRLQRYLKECRVCQSTSIMVQEQVEQRLKIQERLKEEDVPVIRLLSNALRVELRHQVVKPHLLSMPLYSILFHTDLSTFQLICMQAVGFAYPHQQDDLFVAGTQTNKAYQLMSGSMVYTQDPEESEVVVEDKVTTVQVDKWLAEAALWSRWTHVGTCKAKSSSHVLTLNAEECMRITYRAPMLRRLFAQYCQVYHAKVVVARPPNEHWCSDLEVPNTGWDILVPEMEQGVREMASLCVVEQLEACFTWIGKHHTLEALRDNIINGESSLIMDSNGQPERLVSAVVAHIHNSEHLQLMKVAQVDDERTAPRPCFKFPKLKLQAAESSEDGLKRLLNMLGLHEDVEPIKEEVLVEHKQSSKFGMRSRCTSTFFDLEADEDPNLPHVARQAPSAPSHRGSTASTLDTSPRQMNTANRNSTNLRSSLASDAGRIKDVDADLGNMTVYKVKAGAKRHFYAWLPDWLVDHFSSAAGKKDLSAWVSSSLKRSNGADRTSANVGGRNSEPPRPANGEASFVLGSLLS